MRSLLRSVLAAAALLGAASSLGAHAQGYRIGNRIIPESSIEHPGDAGKRAHTHLQILAGPAGGLGVGGGISPAQMRTFYNLPSTGGSQIVAIVDAYDDPNALSDFNAFAAQYGLAQESSTNATASTNTVFQVLYGNGSKPATDSTGGWELEESLDFEWAHAMAPNAKIVLVEALDNSFANLFGAEDTAANYTDGNGHSVREVSNSWSSGEFAGENTYDSHFTSANAAFFASTGDSGAPGGYPATSPYVVAVGGTTCNTDSSGNLTSETGWSGSGGGPSTQEARPAYQNGISGIVGAARGIPDISADADPNSGASVYDTFPYNGTPGTWWIVGGTSLSCPMTAGIANLAATSAGAFPAGSQVLLTNIYNNLGTSNFRDITSGSNGYSCMVGWDFVTGVGSCLGLAGLQSGSGTPDFSLSASPSSQTVIQGNGTSYTATVTPSGGFSGVVTFSVSGLPSGASANFNPTSVTGSGSSTMSVSTSTSTPVGTYTLTITGASGSLNHTASVTLVVNAPSQGDFSLSASPSSRSVRRGRSTTYTVTVTPSGGFSGTVSFSVSGLPSGASASFNPTTVTGSGSTTMTVTAGGTRGTFTLTIKGTSGSLQHTTTVTLTITR